jgi:hypothetical protein
LYHKNTIEDFNEEILNPSEKVWAIVKYINNSSSFSQRVFKTSIFYRYLINVFSPLLGLQDQNWGYFEIWESQI